MTDFVSTFDQVHPKTEICVVYDERDGRIVHMHEFIGDGTGMLAPDAEAERARVALERAVHHHGHEHLRAAHAPRDFRFEPNTLYRFDVKAGKLASFAQTGLSISDRIERRRKLNQK